MEVKSMTGNTVELLESSFGKAPKALDAVDMMMTTNKFIAAMLDAKVLGITDIHQAVIATPAVAVDGDFGSHTAPNDGLQRGFGAVRHNLGVDLAASLPLLFKRPKTGVLPAAPRLRLPLTRRAPK